MKGPQHRIKHDVGRQWLCPRCGLSVRTRGDVTSHLCHCDRKDPANMNLVDLPAVRFVIPDPGEEPQSQAELLLTSADLVSQQTGELPELPRTLTMHDTLTEEIAARVEAESREEKERGPSDETQTTTATGESADNSATNEAATEADGTAKKKKRSRRRRNRRRKKKS